MYTIIESLVNDLQSTNSHLSAYSPAYLPVLVAGARLRLEDEALGGDLEGTLQRAIEGEETPRQVVARASLAAFSEADLDAVDGLASGLAVRLIDDYERLDEVLDLDEDMWWKSLGELLEYREELQSILCALRLVGVAPRLEGGLNALDGSLRMFLRSLPVEPAVRSSWLQLAALRDPDAWWAEPALMDATG